MHTSGILVVRARYDRTGAPGSMVSLLLLGRYRYPCVDSVKHRWPSGIRWIVPVCYLDVSMDVAVSLPAI